MYNTIEFPCGIRLTIPMTEPAIQILCSNDFVKILEALKKISDKCQETLEKPSN